jgi:hypothetical protein
MIEADLRSVFKLCKEVCQEAVDEIERLYKEQEAVKLALKEATSQVEEAVTHRDIAIRERDATAYRFMQ